MPAQSFKLINADIWFSMCQRLKHKGIYFQAFRMGNSLCISAFDQLHYSTAIKYLKKMGVIGKPTDVTNKQGERKIFR